MKMKTRIEKYVEREGLILERCRGKRVLHLGCVAFTDCPVEEKVKMAQTSLHARVSEVSDCIGLDIDEKAIVELAARGIYKNVRAGDVEKLDALADELGRFDVVLAGDIIEHLSNPGKMLDGAKAVLASGGELIVSTPNSQDLPAYVRFLMGRYHEGEQHVLCFNPQTLGQLVRRHGYRTELTAACYQRRAKRGNILFPVASGLLKIFPQSGGTLIFICKPERAGPLIFPKPEHTRT
jgi:SAM-dependent methyltransferase